MKALLATTIIATLTLTAAAVEEKDVQGQYDGTFLEGSWKDWPASATVVAEGNGNYRVSFRAGNGFAQLNATTSEKGANPTFKGNVQLESEEFDVQGAYNDAKFECVLTGPTTHKIVLERVTRGSPTLGAKPPEGAIVLMGNGNLDAWESRPEKWHLTDNGARVANPYLVTKQAFGDHKLHLEFMTPFMPHDRGQARGNSGVYIHGVYEIQVLDSFGLPPADNGCGGIYKIATPVLNACLPPLQWQTYDVTFRAARFDADGKKTENARITVLHNNVPIHDDIELPTITGGAIRPNEAATGPLMLQHHNDPVDYGNIWVLPLD